MHNQVTKTRLRQNRRILELKIVSRERSHNPLALLVAATAVLTGGIRPNRIHIDESPCLHVK